MTTVRDVAKSAGVSISTVSRALSMPHMVNPKTRAMVIAAAQELGYEPNRAAQRLRSGVTKTIGLVIPDIENPFFAAITKGVQSRLRRGGYSVFIADSDEDFDQETELIHSLAKQVDGLILASPRAEESKVFDAIGSKPVIVMNRKVGDLPSILVDNSSGVVQVLDHLEALGHTTIAYACGPENSWSSGERMAEVRKQAHLRPNLTIVELGYFRPYLSGGYQAADLAVAKGATALFAYNDLVALGALERLRQRGIKVPDQMSVVGFDDVSLASLSYPSLTTVNLPLREFGRKAVDVLTARLADPALTVQDLTVPVELLIRNSTAEPPH